MDRNYSTSGFADPPPPPPPAPPAAPAAAGAAAQPPASAWAYESGAAVAAASSGSSPILKASLSYEEGHSSHSETDLLQRQTFAAPQQLPGYTTTPQPTGLSGLFDPSVNSASTNSKESSVMNFLSAVESQTAQAASSGTTLLPQFRAPSWQTGMHSSAASELFVTGPLPTTGTLPPAALSALSAYQHPTTFSNRNFATTSPLVLQDSIFNTTSNGILSPNDPLLQIKTCQGTVPSALAFERLGSSALSNSTPPQSSTYRSAQESAPHLLQPQFSLLPSALGGNQQTPQAYGSTLLTNSTASIERALLRECSVIKHHQRPSGTQTIQAQLTGSQHSLHSYLSNTSVVNFQETTRQSSLSCSPVGDSTQVSNGELQQKTSQVSVELAQSYSSAIPSSGYPPSTEVKNCSTKQPLASTTNPKPQNIIPPVQTLSYSKPLHNQSSVISGQAQIYSTAQLPSLLSVSQSQNYGLVQPHNVPSIVHSQVYRSNKVEKLPSVYKTLTFSGPSQSLTSENQTLNYSSSQQEVLSSAASDNYPAQTRELSSVSQSQSYSSGHSQGLSPVSQTTVSYSSQSQVLSVVSPSESYASGQSLTLTAPSLSYTNASQAQSLPESSPSQNYISVHSTQNVQTQDSSSPQTQKFLPSVQPTSFASSTHCQTLQSNVPSPDPKTYAERKLDSSAYATSKQENNFPVQVLQTQVSLESSTQRVSDGEMNAQESVYKVSKADDRYSESVIRNNSHLEDQVVGIALQGPKEEESVVGSVTQLNQQIGQVNNTTALDIKKTTNLMQMSQVKLSTEDLNPQHSLIHKVHEAKTQDQHDQTIHASSQIQAPNHAFGHGHQPSVPNPQVLLDSTCDLQILQQSILQAGLDQAKTSVQVQRVQSPQQIVHPFLQMDGHIIQSNGDHSQQQQQQQQQQQLHPQNSEILKMDLSESSKPLQHLTTKGHFSTSQPDSKNQFVSLGSICFPDAMLLGDERHILSNVDDILAATVAACGVTPDFTKSIADEPIPTVEAGDSKPHFQPALHVGPETSDFNVITATVGKPQTLNDISLNGNQVTVSLSPVLSLQSKVTLDQQHVEMSGQNKAALLVVGPNHEIQEQNPGIFKKQSATSHECEEDSEVPIENALNNNRNQEFVSSSRSISGESATSESEFTLVGDDSGVSMNTTRSIFSLLTMAQSGDASSVKTDDENQDTHFGLQKKKIKGKGQTKDESNSNEKQLKRPAPGKRQTPRGTDTYLPYTPSSESCHDGDQHQEKMRQKIREVEEKQPEVKTGFIASFLDFLKSGPKQQFSTLAVRMPNKTRRPGAQIVRTFCPPPFPKTSSATPTSLVSETGDNSLSEKVDNELKNLKHLSLFSSDEDDSGVCSQDIYKGTSASLLTLDATSDIKKKTEALQVTTTSTTPSTGSTVTTSSTTMGAAKQEPLHSPSSAANVLESTKSAEPAKPTELDGLPSEQFAKGQENVAIEGFTDEENIESGGEGQYKERDEFVVKIEDIETFKEALKMGKEPPAIWKVQKALLQKFVPEIRDGQREFAATNSYLGYFGDAKSKYKRIYVKFIDNSNKKEYVRVCSKKPRNKLAQPVRLFPSKPSSSNKTSDPLPPKTATTKTPSSMKPKVKQPKVKAEPPPKKRKKWKEEFSSSQSDSSPEIHSSSSEDEEFDPPAPFVSRFLNTRAMKETFKSYMELLVSIALDPDTMQALEKSNDELLLPHMKKIDSMLNDNRKRLLLNLHLDQPFKNALESFPELTIITRDSKAKSGGSAISKIKMNGKTYNKKTLRTSKATTKSTQEFAVDPEKIQLYCLYHSLHHYKYHVYLICKNEISSVQKKNEDLGQEEIVQLCMKNVKWVEDLFEKFGELLNHVQQKCS